MGGEAGEKSSDKLASLPGSTCIPGTPYHPLLPCHGWELPNPVPPTSTLFPGDKLLGSSHFCVLDLSHRQRAPARAARGPP